MSDINRTKGVYFLTCDAMYELSLAFLESFRHFNPQIDLFLIPYNSEVDAILRLAESYNFKVIGNCDLLRLCDVISTYFHAGPVGQYRKLMAWEGPCDDFIYIDIDTIVLNDVGFAFDYLEQFDVIAAESNVRGTNQFTWKKRPTHHFSAEQIDFAANTGFVTSRKGTISIEFALKRVHEALLLADFMELTCTEQPLLNYLFIESGARCTSLRNLSMCQPHKNSIPLQIWGGALTQEDNAICAPPARSFPPLMIHWAGVWREGAHLTNALWRYYRDCGQCVVEKGIFRPHHPSG
jgi:hypothetical protein